MSDLSVLLQSIDPATQSWLERKRFSIPNLEALAHGLNLDEIEPYRVYHLTPADMAHVEQTYGVAFDDKSLAVIMSVDHGKWKYDEQTSHTGRELLLMLQGKKPFAHFSKVDRPEEEGVAPEEFFEPHVESGRFVKRVDFIEMTRLGPLLRIYYAVPGEAWRIDAFRSLWHLAGKYGWGDGCEKMEGFLLGYEPDIDPFFKTP